MRALAADEFYASSPRSQKDDKTMVRTLAIIMGTFLICRMPMTIHFLVVVISGDPLYFSDLSRSTRDVFEFLTLLITFMNPAIDPIIYFYRVKQMRKAIKTVFCCERNAEPQMSVTYAPDI